MKVLIIEDEGIAARRLEKLLRQIVPRLEVLQVLDTVKSTIHWLKNNKSAELIFFDIHLADGLSFEVFEEVKPKCPVIFTTAYDQYAIKAFEVNSIDYLLKPIEEEKLKRAIEKFHSLETQQTLDLSKIQSILQNHQHNYKERFVVKIGDHLKTIAVKEVFGLLSQGGSTYLLTEGNKKVIIDYSLDQLVDLLDPNAFFRINRKFIVKMSAITDIIAYSNSRLRIVLESMEDSQEMIVARDRVPEFKSWLDG